MGRIPDLSKIEVIDTHVHVWQADSPWMGWLDNRPSSWNVVRRDFSWENLCTELDAAGIHELMLMQASPDCEETKLYLELADNHPRVRGVVGWASLLSGERTAADLEGLRGPGFQKLVGIRNNHGWAPDGEILATSAVFDSCRLLAERGLTLDLHFQDQRELPLAIKIADQFPDLVLVINHMGKPLIAEEGFFEPWKEAIGTLAQYPNIYLKYSGWATFLGEARAGTIKPYIEYALNEFGANRVMFASNWPVALVADSYENTYRASINALPGLSQEELQALFRDTALRCYSMPERHN